MPITEEDIQLFKSIFEHYEETDRKLHLPAYVEIHKIRHDLKEYIGWTRGRVDGVLMALRDSGELHLSADHIRRLDGYVPTHAPSMTQENNARKTPAAWQGREGRRGPKSS